MIKDKAYLYGVILGDGFFGKESWKKEGYAYLLLKSIDIEFVEKFRSVVQNLTGKQYSIYKNTDKGDGKKRQPCHLCKCYAKELVTELVAFSNNKTEIPNFIKDGDSEIKLAFIQGLMDSEGYITMSISSLKQWNVGIYLACTASWMKDVYRFFKECDIKTSDLSIRKMKDGRKDVFWFKIDIQDYIDKGLSFCMTRKKSRLEFIAKILRDFTSSYKMAYKIACVEDKVQAIV